MDLNKENFNFNWYLFYKITELSIEMFSSCKIILTYKTGVGRFLLVVGHFGRKLACGWQLFFSN